MNTVKTVWLKRVYDVWGNADDGYIVNDSYSDGEVKINCPVVLNNAGTINEFESAYPSNRQLKKIFDCDDSIVVEGDDTVIYVYVENDYYPLGELSLISHESLSPIRVK